MAENTSVGPGGANKSALSAKKPKSHGTHAKDGKSGNPSVTGAAGGGAPSSDVNPGKTGNPVNNGGS